MNIFIGHTLDDSGVGSSSSNIVKLDQTNCDPSISYKSMNETFHKSGDRVHFPDLVALPISENDMQLQAEREDSLTYQTGLLTNPDMIANKSSIGFANTLFDLQQREVVDPNRSIINDMWAPNISSATNLLGRSMDSEADISNFQRFGPNFPEDETDFQKCDFTLPRKPLRSNHYRLKSSANISDYSLPRKKNFWRDIPNSYTEANFGDLKEELPSSKLSSNQLYPETRTNDRRSREKAFLAETDPSHVLLFQSSSHNSANSKNPTYIRGFLDCDSSELNFCENEAAMENCYSAKLEDEIDMSAANGVTNNTNLLLAKQLNKRSQLLHALVQDQNDTIV